MRVALIRPGLGGLGRRRYRSWACLEPLSLAILAGLTPPDVEVATFDDRFEDVPLDERFDLVALSVDTFPARRAYELADGFRARGVPVVAGGFHPTFCPDEALEHVTAVVRGEAEGLWPGVVEDARRGRLQRVYAHESPPDLAGVRPDHGALHRKHYMPMSVIQYGRGCSHACDFCCIKAFYPGAVRFRPVADVVSELAAATYRWVFFVDDNLAADAARAKELLRAIQPLGLRWSSQMSLDFVDDPELLRLMVASGCESVVIGLESLDAGNMAQMGKGWAKVQEYERRLAAVRDAGIMVYATFVFGYDGDGPDVFERTFDFAMRQKFFLVNFNHLQPYPGTRLYERLRSEGRLLYERWWLDPGYRFGDAVFHPKGMTAAQLTEGTSRIRERFHRYGSILSRAWEGRANCKSLRNAWTFLLANVSSRQDVERKAGLRLGSAA